MIYIPVEICDIYPCKNLIYISVEIVQSVYRAAGPGAVHPVPGAGGREQLFHRESLGSHERATLSDH